MHTTIGATMIEGCEPTNGLDGQLGIVSDLGDEDDACERWPRQWARHDELLATIIRAERSRLKENHPSDTRTSNSALSNDGLSRTPATPLAVCRTKRPPLRRWFNDHLPSIVLILIIYSANYLPASEAVDCFKCSSRNGSNPDCEDPFHNTNSTRVMTPYLPEPIPSVVYHTPCYAGKKGRDGLFPASACIKLTGKFDTTGESLVVRHCALDSGSLTQDTELARMSHCGKFQFEGDLLRGCVLACPEDACNSANSLDNLAWTHVLVVCSMFILSAYVVYLH